MSFCTIGTLGAWENLFIVSHQKLVNLVTQTVASLNWWGWEAYTKNITNQQNVDNTSDANLSRIHNRDRYLGHFW